MYPAGKRLSPVEAKQSLQHAPRGTNGKPLCWDNSCWSGCSKGQGNCSHSHDPIKGLGNLHWTVVAQLLRRGGLRSGPKVAPDTVDGRIAQLRSQAKGEEAAKASPKAKAKSGGKGAANKYAKAGYNPPDEFQEVHFTEQEDELRRATLGA